MVKHHMALSFEKWSQNFEKRICNVNLIQKWISNANWDLKINLL